MTESVKDYELDRCSSEIGHASLIDSACGLRSGFG